MYSPAACYSCHGPLDNNPAIDGALVICGECAPNARLIAAAPRMLAELKHHVCGLWCEHERCAVIRAILRDVEGESND